MRLRELMVMIFGEKEVQRIDAITPASAEEYMRQEREKLKKSTEMNSAG